MMYDSNHFQAKEKAMADQNHQQEEPITHPELQGARVNPADYLETVFSLYREDKADYRGRRDEDQQFIAEYAAEEADEFFDQALLGVLALRNTLTPDKKLFIKPDEQAEREITLGNFEDGASLQDMRSAWRQLWVGFNILTNRLHRDSSEFTSAGNKEVFSMVEADKEAVKQELFGNFQELNALRFGAKGSGVHRNRWDINLDSGEPEKIRVDADKARYNKDIANNAARRGYTVKPRKEGHQGAIHPAGKMKPEEFTALRRQYPEVDMDKFARDAAYLKDIAKYYEETVE